ncbi:MAG: hypothetical protein JST00_28800 [Deltaproteobacteria bacterium]|nr:hypothetical protein [Deltaproteobacteria bacterium]
MQNGAHEKPDLSGTLLGFVRVVVGGQVFDLPVQSIHTVKDGENEVGGFFAKDGQIGILVDGAATEPEKKALIEKATAEAVRHLSQRFLN